MNIKTQYDKIRAEWESNTITKDSNVLFMFRIGEYFEFFFADAEIAAEKAGLKLENRHGFPIAGFYFVEKVEKVKKLLAAGYSVAEVANDGSGWEIK